MERGRISQMAEDLAGDFDQVSTVLQHRFTPSVPTATFRVRVVEGAEQGLEAMVDGVDPAQVLVGQSEACHLRITDLHASRRHCSLETVGDRLRLTDCNSTNGTFIGALRVFDVGLVGGELVRVGSTVLAIERVGQVAHSVVTTTGFGAIIGASHEMRRLYPLCEKLAAADVPVIIEGETGTGKEVLAESLHEAGPRARGPFIVFDCTSVAPSLAESELFGHERGAFTGAVAMRRGVFEQAHGGTLLIDEIGDLEATLQPKLLRALERGEIRRVGSERTIKVDVRVLSATRRDLDHEVQERRFRDDLFHRLAVARIELPPLRKRKGDVMTLAYHFCEQLGASPERLGGALLSRWDDYAWPGNVRELRNAVARHLALGDLAEVNLKSAPAEPTSADYLEHVLAQGLSLPAARQKVVDEFEQRYVARVLAAHGGNVTHAARASGLGRRYFQELRGKTGK